jgi:flagellar protein FlaF
MWYTASANSFERVTDAESAQTDAALSASNTDIEIDSATYNASGNDNLVVQVNNTGAAQLDLDSTDLIVDGDYVTGWQNSATVAGNGDTRLWLGSEQLTITVSRTTQPGRVKVVTESGVSDTAEVTSP